MAVSVQSPPGVLRFGKFELDPTSGELHQNGYKIPLAPKAFELLRALVEHPGQVVTREELRAKLWAADTFVEFDDSLNHTVKKLRQALGDSAENPQFIETLPRYGYRFIASVESPCAPARKPAPRRTRGTAAFVVGAALLALGAALLGFNVGGWRGRLFGRASGPPIRSLAVLPLSNLSGDPQQDYFADGMTDALITDLAKVQAVKVISRTSVMQFKDAKKPLPEIARMLGVDGIIEGSVQRYGEHVRITVQLIRAPTDAHLWAKSYERDTRDVLSLQGEIAQAVAHEIRAALTPEESTYLVRASPVNPEAYELYLKGRYHSNRRTLPGFEKSIQLFQQALAKDSGFALAYAGIAESYGLLAFYGGASSREAFPKAKAAALRAVELDSSLSEAHAALGFVLFYGDWDWPTTEIELKHAIELKPSYVVSHHWYAEYLSAMGRHDQAIAEIKRAQELDPLSPLLFAIGGEVYILARRYDEVIEQCQRALDLDPNYALAHRNLAAGFAGKGMYREAAEEYVKADQLWGLTNSSGRAIAYALTGKRAEGLNILRRLRESPEQPKLNSVMEARLCIGAALCGKEETLDWLEKAYEEHDVYVPLWNVLPEFDPIRSNPRFQALLRRLRFPS